RTSPLELPISRPRARAIELVPLDDAPGFALRARFDRAVEAESLGNGTLHLWSVITGPIATVVQPTDAGDTVICATRMRLPPQVPIELRATARALTADETPLETVLGTFDAPAAVPLEIAGIELDRPALLIDGLVGRPVDIAIRGTGFHAAVRVAIGSL